MKLSMVDLGTLLILNCVLLCCAAIEAGLFTDRTSGIRVLNTLN